VEANFFAKLKGLSLFSTPSPGTTLLSLDTIKSLRSEFTGNSFGSMLDMLELVYYQSRQQHSAMDDLLSQLIAREPNSQYALLGLSNVSFDTMESSKRTRPVRAHAISSFPNTL